MEGVGEGVRGLHCLQDHHLFLEVLDDALQVLLHVIVRRLRDCVVVLRLREVLDDALEVLLHLIVRRLGDRFLLRLRLADLLDLDHDGSWAWWAGLVLEEASRRAVIGRLPYLGPSVSGPAGDDGPHQT